MDIIDEMMEDRREQLRIALENLRQTYAVKKRKEQEMFAARQALEQAIQQLPQYAAYVSARDEYYQACHAITDKWQAAKSLAWQIYVEEGDPKPARGVEVRARWVTKIRDYDQAKIWAKRNKPEYIYEQLDVQGLLSERPSGAPIVYEDEVEVLALEDELLADAGDSA